MKCRICKNQYDSEDWRETGTMNGFCSDECRAKVKGRVIKFNELINTMNKIGDEE